MKVLVLYDYPPSPGGLATQGNNLYKGLKELGVQVRPAPLRSDSEKEWYYRQFSPDVTVGVGYWGHLPEVLSHAEKFNTRVIPWLVANGFVANYQSQMNKLPFMLVTSNWVKNVYVRDGVKPDIIDVLPVGIEMDAFTPRCQSEKKVKAIREMWDIGKDQIMILTVGGDAASKGGREVMRALARIESQVPDWHYLCKVWPQARTDKQTESDLALARELGIADRVTFSKTEMSRNIMPYLMNACDIYAGPSRLEGFGMPHVEASASGKPVIAADDMAFKDTMVHGETAFLAEIEKENVITSSVLGKEAGFQDGYSHKFLHPVVADYRAGVDDVAEYLLRLMNDRKLRKKMGKAGRKYVEERFGYRTVARRFLELVSREMEGES
ncbi:glycosyltransferase family 4 protein [Candidatus Bipolaricaulota bacterium]|nr:glycosyltransferase family 4 protein [Candidatus Bipolaricaulota bacterium]